MKKNKSLFLLSIGLGLALAAVWLLALAGFGIPEARAASFTVCAIGCDYSVIQDAVDAASDGDVIKIAAGTYDDVNNHGGLAQVVYIVKSITIQGGYSTAFTEPPDSVANPTTLDAGGLGRVIYIEGNINPTIAGLRITGGEAKDLGSPIGIDTGGGVMVISATATLKDNYIYDNSADSSHNGDGGGVYLYQSNAFLEGNTIISNTAQREGGGVGLIESAATLTGNTISNNDSRGLGGSDGINISLSPATLTNNTISANLGRGVFVGESAVTLQNNTIISNTGGGLFLWKCDNVRIIGNNISHNSNGEGIWTNGDNVTIQGNTISHNTADWFAGVDISVESEGVRFIGNTISFNTAVNDGGGVAISGNGDLIGNTFISNTAGGGGGGLCLLDASSEVSISGNTFIGNTADTGGGLALSGEGHQLINNLIVDNHATNCCGSGLHIAGATSLRLLHNTISRNTGAGGIGLSVLGNSTVAMTNTILVSQTVGIDVQTGSTTTLEATLWGSGAWANTTDWIGDGTIITGTVNIWGDPDFVDYLAGDYHIGENSDAIDAGIDAGVTTDIDGPFRPYQLPDIGADEYWPPGVLKFIYLPLVIK